MFTIAVCVLVSLAINDVQSRYVHESNIPGAIETNKIISAFEEAVSQCKTEGAVLAAPVNEQLRDEMIALIGVNNHSTPYFINAKLEHSHNPQFVSSEGVSLDDMSVSDMIEELDPRDGECLAMDSRTIRVVSCSAPLPYMCYKENDTISNTTEREIGNDTESEINCGTSDQEYEYYNDTGSCYKFHPQYTTWNDARAICETEGGYLVVLNNELEAQVVHDMGNYYIHVGIHDSTNDNKGWKSIRGDRLEDIYNEWNNALKTYDGEHCAIMIYIGGLNYNKCDDERAFLCEKDVAV
ncbi:uncharacterized protein LOC142983923 [Anticarsia gemmatalis]|uniref:uncharacterized protein LOC142983923 n=1 Tax=Anticarsia gemmatalis TaxID=129554 RepID=UPI003F766F1B